MTGVDQPVILPELLPIALNGFKPYVTKRLPTKFVPAKYLSGPAYDKLLKKFVKFIKRGYFIFPSLKTINGFIDYFYVSKGADGIRTVFNGTNCGLTDSLCYPNFWLPTANILLRSTAFNSKFVDVDFGEMFHNFPLHESLIPYSGVDLTPFRKDLNKLGLTNKLKGPKLLVVWTRTWMGLKTSPEHCVRYYYFIEEFIRGSEREEANPL